MGCPSDKHVACSMRLVEVDNTVGVRGEAQWGTNEAVVLGTELR